jgi:peptide deformylase
MSLLPITLYGDKILRKKASKVENVDFETVELIRDMFDTMRNANGIGLAANQVGADKSIFVIDVSVVEGYEEVKPMAVINPVITFRSEGKESVEEGCLSIPNIRGEVPRSKKITLKYYDSDMNEHQIDAEHLLARVLQHEFDHLKGILFTDLVDDETKRKLKPDLNKIKNRRGEFEYPVSANKDYQI